MLAMCNILAQFEDYSIFTTSVALRKIIGFTFNAVELLSFVLVVTQ